MLSIKDYSECEERWCMGLDGRWVKKLVIVEILAHNDEFILYIATDKDSPGKYLYTYNKTKPIEITNCPIKVSEIPSWCFGRCLNYKGKKAILEHISSQHEAVYIRYLNNQTSRVTVEELAEAKAHTDSFIIFNVQRSYCFYKTRENNPNDR